jgi:hypothetical protein
MTDEANQQISNNAQLLDKMLQFQETLSNAKLLLSAVEVDNSQEQPDRIANENAADATNPPSPQNINKGSKNEEENAAMRNLNQSEIKLVGQDGDNEMPKPEEESEEEYESEEDE